MERQTQIDLAQVFRRMHDRTSVLLLPNAWDAGSARLFAQCGFAAIATTSAGVAWSLGYARLRAAREAADASGVPIVIDARVDNWMQHDDADAAARLADATRRARAYLAAGADCIYPIGLRERATLALLAKALDAPINVNAGPGTPDLAELARLGIARVSTATRFATLALAAVDRAASSMLASGRFDGLAADFTYADAQRLFEPAATGASS